MENMASQSSITLVIKAPNQRVRDIEVSCLLDWTVEKLKTHLANVYPTKPARSSQKIIYSGKLLDDHFILKDVLLLENEGQHQTVHLVCTPMAPGNHQSSWSPTVSDPPPPIQATTTPEVSSTPSTTTQPAELRHRHQQAYHQHPFFNAYHGNPATFQNNGHHQVNANAAGTHYAYGQSAYGAHYAAQHMAHMQWMHHMAQMQGLPYIPIQPPIPYPQQTIPQPPVNPPAPAAQAVQAQERQGNRPQNRNRVMNANAGGGGMMQQDDDDDEENVQRDWLDYIYIVIRIFVLMSIFWFYSSAERLILMGVTIFVVWMLQSGWFNLNRAQRNRHQDFQANAENNPEAGGAEEEGEDDEDEEDEEDGGGSDSGETEDDTDINTTTDSNDSAPQQPEHPGYFVVVFNFITTFFSSLVPHGPRAVAQP